MRNYGTIPSYSIPRRIDFANTDFHKIMTNHRYKSVYSASPAELLLTNEFYEFYPPFQRWLDLDYPARPLVMNDNFELNYETRL
jgi:hypothetical protein